MLKSEKDLLSNLPLYSPQKFDQDDHGRLFRLKFFTGTFDYHCEQCGAQSTFKGTSEGLSIKGYKVPDFKNFKLRYLTDYPVISNELLNQIYVVEAECASNPEHRKMVFMFRVTHNSIEKIGQYPPPVPNEEEVELRFKNADELYDLLNLASSKIELGSFVYLEPAFRTKIEEAIVLFADAYFDSNSKDIENWDAEAYAASSTSEKIALLQQQLPTLSDEHKAAFSVLGNGIYNMTEEDCTNYIPMPQLEDKEEKKDADAEKRRRRKNRNKKRRRKEREEEKAAKESEKKKRRKKKTEEKPAEELEKKEEKVEEKSDGDDFDLSDLEGDGDDGLELGDDALDLD